MEAIIISLLLTIIASAAGISKWMLNIIEKKSDERDKQITERIDKFEGRIDKLFENYNNLYIAFTEIKKDLKQEKEKKLNDKKKLQELEERFFKKNK